MKKIKVVFWAGIFLLVTVICHAAPQAEARIAPPVLFIPEWTLTIVTPNGEKQFGSVDAAALSVLTMEATLRNSRGEENTSTYTGVRLADVLKAVGASDFSSLTIIASDDFSVSYSRDLAMADDTLIAWEIDGAILTTDPPLRMAPKQGVGNQFVRQVVRIVVNP